MRESAHLRRDTDILLKLPKVIWKPAELSRSENDIGRVRAPEDAPDQIQ
jgi:hypothetical protein